MVGNCHTVVSLEAGRGAVHAKMVVLGDLSSQELLGCMAQNDLQSIKRFHMPGVGCSRMGFNNQPTSLKICIFINSLSN